jgi:hypothetical protein
VPDHADGIVDLIHHLQNPFHVSDCMACAGPSPCVRSHTCYAVSGCVGFWDMQRILVLNPKGGSGKTTMATNLASYFASQGDHPLLSDNDPQGSSTRWLKKRKPEQAFIHGIAAFERNTRMTRAWQMRIPPDAAHVVVDTPAAVLGQDMPEMTKRRRRDHHPGASVGHRHSRVLEVHRRSAADRQGAARRESHRRDGQPRQAQHRYLSIPDALPGHAAHSRHRNASATRRTTCAPQNKASVCTK